MNCVPLPMFPSKEILRITVSRTTDGAADDGEIVTVGHSGGGCRGRHRHCRQFRAACLDASLSSAFLVAMHTDRGHVPQMRLGLELIFPMI